MTGQELGVFQTVHRVFAGGQRQVQVGADDRLVLVVRQLQDRAAGGDDFRISGR